MIEPKWINADKIPEIVYDYCSDPLILRTEEGRLFYGMFCKNSDNPSKSGYYKTYNFDEPVKAIQYTYPEDKVQLICTHDHEFEFGQLVADYSTGKMRYPLCPVCKVANIDFKGWGEEE
jgi:hypothetical protein